MSFIKSLNGSVKLLHGTHRYRRGYPNKKSGTETWLCSSDKNCPGKIVTRTLRLDEYVGPSDSEQTPVLVSRKEHINHEESKLSRGALKYRQYLKTYHSQRACLKVDEDCEGVITLIQKKLSILIKVERI